MEDKDPQALVQDFHVRYGHVIDAAYEPWSEHTCEELDQASVTVLALAIRLRNDPERPKCVLVQRASLMLEELGETLRALAFPSASKVELADGLADLAYVLYGTGVALGVPVDECLREVHRSNMTKEPGAFKPVKGDDFVPPDLKSIVG